MIKFDFTNLRCLNTLVPPSDVTGDIFEADIYIKLGDRVFFREHSFPVVEFGQQLVKWIRHLPQTNTDYVSEISGTDETGWISFATADLQPKPKNLDSQKPVGETRWYINSLYAEFEATQAVSFDEIAKAVASYVEALIGEIKWRFGYEISPLFDN